MVYIKFDSDDSYVNFIRFDELHMIIHLSQSNLHENDILYSFGFF